MFGNTFVTALVGRGSAKQLIVAFALFFLREFLINMNSQWPILKQIRIISYKLICHEAIYSYSLKNIPRNMSYEPNSDTFL